MQCHTCYRLQYITYSLLTTGQTHTVNTFKHFLPPIYYPPFVNIKVDFMQCNSHHLMEAVSVREEAGSGLHLCEPIISWLWIILCEWELYWCMNKACMQLFLLLDPCLGVWCCRIIHCCQTAGEEKEEKNTHWHNAIWEVKHLMLIYIYFFLHITASFHKHFG